MIQVLFSVGLMMLAPGDVVVSEIMYNPDGATLGADDDMEWVELCNLSGETINLGGIMLSDGNNQIFLQDYLMVPGEYVVVCAGSEAFASAYGLSDIPVVNWNGTWIKQSNSGDTVIIYSDTGEVIDEVTFSDQWGVSGVPGKSPADGEGSSLEKLDLSGSDTEDNWFPSRDFEGSYTDDGPTCRGTPGRANSL